MRLKKFILYTIVLSLIFMGIGAYYNIPVAFISENPSGFEYVVANILVAGAKAVVILSIIVHIRNNIRIERFCRRKQKVSR